MSRTGRNDTARRSAARERRALAAWDDAVRAFNAMRDDDGADFYRFAARRFTAHAKVAGFTTVSEPAETCYSGHGVTVK